MSITLETQGQDALVVNKDFKRAEENKVREVIRNEKASFKKIKSCLKFSNESRQERA